jgi:hypothetical protein
MNIDIGIDEPARREVADGLGRLLADSYTLYWRPTVSTGTSAARSSRPCT